MIVLTQIDRRTRVGSLILDVLSTEEIDFSSDVTKYPTEDGSVITDHITEGNEKIRISGMIGTADIAGGFGNLSGLVNTPDSSVKLVTIVEILRGMHKARQLITVSTGQMLYENMAFTSLNAQRSSDGNGGNWLSIKAEMTKVVKVRLKTADVPARENINTTEPAAGRAGATGAAAGRTTPTSTTPVRPQSTIRAIGQAGYTPQAGIARLSSFMSAL